jgi:hypothetical protein
MDSGRSQREVLNAALAELEARQEAELEVVQKRHALELARVLETHGWSGPALGYLVTTRAAFGRRAGVLGGNEGGTS